ncbi:Cof-type HAD-IIB family hydrolase [Cytobacillus sp. S13-E01]|uniref:Cof-type HAD-IIB family hydrolase n=1 Tax=Cytobacillus sp. S13-E01 TaxID=3031326 RepID=UPI0023D84FED|nr:Cof-type HAD-IIB family hydrolase [Cytobacillus sp. S13-E01]MDF0725358.1 Cof-type HAD-IIB family hydrolase [Cytobacillus sp. S13-E01]
MKKKLVFFDIDGTLLDHDKNLPLSTKLAIKNLQEVGVNVAIATGRAPFMFQELRRELGITSYISFNGQYVVYEGEVIYKNPLDSKLLPKLKEHANESNHPIVFMNESVMRSSVESHQYIHESMGSLKFEHPAYDPNFYTNREIFQALLFCTKEEEETYVSKYPAFHFIRWHDYSTDIIPLGGSKAEGIKKMMESIAIDRENVYAFGDGLNDAEMLDFVGTGIAMGNALDEIKKRADIVTKDVDNDGILHGLRLVGLLK